MPTKPSCNNCKHTATEHYQETGILSDTHVGLCRVVFCKCGGYEPEDELPQPVSGMTYWEIISEIDASMFVLEDMARKSARRAPIERMIDDSTGFDKHMTDEAKIIVTRVKELQAALPPDDPHFVKPKASKG